jgi:Ca2+-dependent lipid-binding protein
MSTVQASIASVASTFVRPESYTLDIDRLLLGREAALRTHTVGVLHIVIHGAEDLPKSDTMGKFELSLAGGRDGLNPHAGSCDPYVSISYSKFNKPSERLVGGFLIRADEALVFSTRTIIDDQNPCWEEPAFSESWLVITIV